MLPGARRVGGSERADRDTVFAAPPDGGVGDTHEKTMPEKKGGKERGVGRIQSPQLL